MKPNTPLWNSVVDTTRRRKPSGRRFVTIALICAVVLALGQVPFVRAAFSGAAFAAAAPLFGSFTSLRARFEEYGALIQDRRTLIQERRALAERVRELEAQNMLTDIIRTENAELKRLLNRRDKNSRSILSGVLSKPNRTPYDTFILDAGQNDGVSQGDVVIAYGSIALGTITEVFARSSRAELFSAPDNEVAVLVGPDSITTTARGRGAGNFTARLPRGAGIEPGMSVVFPGITPRLVASVGDVQTKPSDSFQTLHFKLPINIYELRFVEIAPDSQESIPEEIDK